MTDVSSESQTLRPGAPAGSNDTFVFAVRSEQVEFRFNLSSVAKTEKILTAELHLFKLRPQATQTFNRHHFCQVRTAKFRPGQSCRAASLFLLMLRVCVLQVSIYQLMESSRSNSTQEKKLLSARLLPVHSSGWEVFTITPAVSISSSLLVGACEHVLIAALLKVRSWMTEEGSNLRLHVVVQTLGGSQVDLKLIRFASGRHHHPSKQPMLVLFTDDGRQSATLESSGEFQLHIHPGLSLSLKTPQTTPGGLFLPQL